MYLLCALSWYLRVKKVVIVLEYAFAGYTSARTLANTSQLQVIRVTELALS